MYKTMCLVFRSVKIHVPNELFLLLMFLHSSPVLSVHHTTRNTLNTHETVLQGFEDGIVKLKMQVHVCNDSHKHQRRTNIHMYTHRCTGIVHVYTT